MFSALQDEMQFIFLEKNFIFLDFSAVKNAIIFVHNVLVVGNKRNLICIALNNVSSGIFNSQKDHEDEVFL